MKPIAPRHRLELLVVFASLLLLNGCASLPPQPAMDISQPGWVIREGQAAWKKSPGSPALAGKLLVALNTDGRNVVQFQPSTGDSVLAQFSTNFWQVRLPGEAKVRTGRGELPQNSIWLQLPEGLLGNSAMDTEWMMVRERGKPFRFHHDATGESLEGTLVTTRMPSKHRLQPGEHIIRVVRRYGITVEALRAVNPGRDLDWFRIGNDINLPAAKGEAEP